MCYHDNLINKASSWEWSQPKPDSGFGVYGDKNKVAIFHSLENDRQILCANPCVAPERYYIEFHITYTQRGSLNIGLCTQKANLSQRCGFDQYGLSLSLFSGCIFHNNKWKSYTNRCKTGDRIGMAVDMSKKELYFFRNNENLGLAFSLDKIPTFNNEKLFPSVSFGDTGDCITIIQSPIIPNF